MFTRLKRTYPNYCNAWRVGKRLLSRRPANLSPGLFPRRAANVSERLARCVESLLSPTISMIPCLKSRNSSMVIQLNEDLDGHAMLALDGQFSRKIELQNKAIDPGLWDRT